MRTAFIAAAAMLALPASAPAGAGHHAAAPAVHGPADGWVYPIPSPGSYALPAIRPAPDAELLDTAGRSRRLSALFAGRVTVVAFLYTRCGDVCPMASMRLAELRALAAADPAVASALGLVSISFDPEHDTPAVMAEHAGHFRDHDADGPDGPPWSFLTAPDAAAIAPVLEAWDQPVVAKRDADDPSGPLAHILRVFLVDPEGMIRNIYSADFLDPRLVLSDVRTLLMGTTAAEAGR